MKKFPSPSLPRREFLVKMGIATAIMHGADQFGACCAQAADSASAKEELFELKPVADGVYAAIAAPRYKVNSNAAVILTNDGVVVVDSHSKASAALALYREIRRVTKLPIKKIINTHFHWDHWQGNQAYRDEFPDVEIITSRRTEERLLDPDANNGGVGYVDKQIAAMPGEINRLKADILAADNPARKARLEANLLQAEAYLEELLQFRPALPTRTLNNSVKLEEGGRTIEVLLLGRAHTDGDVFIYLPKEKVVATGDALIDWMPFMNDAFIEDWVDTLSALERFDFTRIIPGHGEVAPREQLAFFRGYIGDIMAAVKKAHAEGASVDEMKRTLPEQLGAKYEKGMSKYPMGQFRERIALNIEMTYRKTILKI